MLFTTMYTVVCITFVLLVARWLSAELGVKAKPVAVGWPWLAGVVGLEAVAKILSDVFDPMGAGNVLLHAIGGGAAGTMLFFYLYAMFDVRMSWQLQAAMLFCFVAALGVLNEMAEFAMELAHVGTFSYGPHDTWRDLAANTSGAFLLWLVVRAVSYVASRTIHGRAGRTIQS